MIEFQEVFKAFVKAHMICPMKWVPKSLQIVKCIPQVGYTLVNNIFLCHFEASGRVMAFRENIRTITIHTEWQLNEV